MADRFEKTNTPGVRVRMVDGEEYLGPGKKWLADWRDHAGRRRTRTFRTKKEAIDHREAVRADARRITAGHAAPPPDARLFEELSDHWLQIKAHKKSIRDDRSMINKHLLPHFSGMPLPTIRKEDADALYTALVGRFSPEGVELQPGAVSKKTAWNILTLLGSMLREAKKQGWLATVPHIERPKLDQQDFVWIDLDQVARLIEAAQEDLAHPQLPVIIAVAAYTGLRVGEILGLRWHDIDFGARRIAVRRSFGDDSETRDTSTKNRALRHVPILGYLLPILQGWEERRSEAPWVFPTETGTPRGADDRHTKEHFHAALVAADITAESVKGGRKNQGRKRPRRAFTFHDLRHSFASNWMQGGGDIFTLSKTLGHGSVTVTMRYAHLSPDAFDGIGVMGGARGEVAAGAGQGSDERVVELEAENAALRASVEALTAETTRQQKMLDRLL